jgi:L-alanine-DL-glutamate epimerase-like enolase superfamily enzyme
VTVVEVRTHRLRALLHTPFVTALRTTNHLETLVVELVDDEGRSGFGEAPQVWRVTGESIPGAEACVQGPLADVVRDVPLDPLEELCDQVGRAVVGNFGAKAAVDVALHDLTAQRQDVSLPRLLGAERHDVETDVTVSAGDQDALVGSAIRHVSDGFGVLKLKLGTDPRTDVAKVLAVRAALGPSVRLRVDANQGWTVRDAIEVISALEDAHADLEFVEQPVEAADLDGLAQVRAAVHTPVMADESVFGLRELAAVIDRGAADLVNLKLAKCGGLSTASAMVRLAQRHGIGFIFGSMMEGPIGVGAVASLAAAVGSTYVSDLDAAWWTAVSPVVGGLRYDGPTVRLPERPGLGVSGLVG